MKCVVYSTYPGIDTYVEDELKENDDVVDIVTVVIVEVETVHLMLLWKEQLEARVRTLLPVPAALKSMPQLPRLWDATSLSPWSGRLIPVQVSLSLSHWAPHPAMSFVASTNSLFLASGDTFAPNRPAVTDDRGPVTVTSRLCD